MINLDQILVFAILLFILISLYKELLGASFTFVVSVVVLGVTGVLTPKEILSGFANEQIAVIIMLLLLGDVIRKTGMVETIFDRVFIGAKSYKGFMGRMTFLVAGFSAFLNNTPLVAVMMPYVNSWCKRNEISPSKFLMPLSYAAILGGCTTLIGTSTNLIVNGLVVDQQIIPGLPSLKIFDFAFVGLPMVLIGIIYLIFFGEKLLPERVSPSGISQGPNRKFIVEAQIRSNSKIIGKTLVESGLFEIKGMFVLEIIRGSSKFRNFSTELVLEEKDILILAADTDVVKDILENDHGISLPTGQLTRKKNTEVVEIVVSHNSTIIGKKVRDINFRAKYDGAIIAIHRNGERIRGKIRHIDIKAGDVLLLYTGEDFVNRSSNTQDFYYLSKVTAYEKIEPYKIWILLGGTVAAILLAAFNLVPLFTSLIVLIMTTLVMKLTTPKELPKSIDYDLGLIIVMSLALGTAMIKSGAAELIADLLITVFLPLGKYVLLLGIYLITAILAAYITNKAAVAIIFPISLTMSTTLGLPYQPFVLVVAFAAAANFITPIGYQTNLMVYGPGGYNFKDFFKIGLPLTIIYMIVAVVVLSLMYF